MSGVVAELGSAERSLVWTVNDYIRDLSISPEDSRVAIADAAGAVSVLDVPHKSLAWSKLAHNLGASLIDWRPDGAIIASAGQDGYIKLWQPQTGEVIKVLLIQGQAQWIEQLKWSPDSKYLAAAAGKNLIVWDSEGKEVVRNEQHRSTISAIAWKQNSQEVATACYKGVSLFKVGHNRPYQNLSCLGSLISLAWSADGKSICAGSQDRILQYWRLSGKKRSHAEMKGYPEKVNLLEWDSAGEYLASSGSKDVIVWTTKGNGPAGTKPFVLEGHAKRVTAMAFQVRSTLLASGAQDGSVLVWGLSSLGFEVSHQWCLDSPVSKLSWDYNLANLIVGTQSGQIYKLDASKRVERQAM